MRVVITGASRGIGAALAAGYRARGAEVTGTARAGRADLVALDMADPSTFPALNAALAGRAVDVLVCNAGINLPHGPVTDGYPPADWAATFAINVTGVFLTVQSLLPNLRPGAKIAIVSSLMGSSERARGAAT